MEIASHVTRYNQRIRQMCARVSSDPRIDSPRSSLLALIRAAAFLLGLLLFPSLLFASSLGDTARQLADRVAAVSGPGAIALDVTNRSSLDEKSLRDVRSEFQAELSARGMRIVASDESMGTVALVLSESIREYVWTAQISIGTDPPRVILVSRPREAAATGVPSALPITLKKTFLYSQEQPILDATIVEMPGGARLLVLDLAHVAVYRQQSGRWELETSLSISSTRIFPRDPRGRLLLRRDHLFDVYLPGTICHSSATAPLALDCMASDDPWPLTPDDNVANSTTVRAFYAPARNFFTGVLSPGIGKITNVPSFYSAAALPRSNYTLWALATVDGSIHLIDGITDQAVRSGRIGSDIAALRSSCGIGTQLLVSGNGDSAHDDLRAFEIPDRDPVTVSAALDFEGRITALWPDATLTAAVAVVRREDTGWYEADRISVACAN